MVGTPAKRIGWISMAGARLGNDLICPIDNSKYELDKNNLINQKMSEYSEKTQFIDLKSQQNFIRPKLEKAIKKSSDHGQYIMGPEVRELEEELKNFTGCKFSLTCANGTDALTLALMAWNVGPGDAIFVPAFTYVASAEAPAQLGASPFFVDVNEHDFNINIESLKQAIVDAKKLNLRPRVIISVDLFGYPSDFNLIKEISTDENIKFS